MITVSRRRAIASFAVVIGLSGFAGVPPAGAQNPNLIPNPEFHQNVADWSSTAGFTALEWDGFDWTECGALSGSALFTHYGPVAGQMAFAYVCAPAIDDATIHSFGGYLRFLTGQAESGTATVYTIWVSGPDCTGNSLGTSLAADTVDSDFDAGVWVQVRVDAAYAPAGTQSAQVVVEMVKDQAGGSLALRLDGFHLVALPGFVFRDGFGLNSTCRWSSELP